MFDQHDKNNFSQGEKYESVSFHHHKLNSRLISEQTGSIVLRRKKIRKKEKEENTPTEQGCLVILNDISFRKEKSPNDRIVRDKCSSADWFIFKWNFLRFVIFHCNHKENDCVN